MTDEHREQVKINMTNIKWLQQHFNKMQNELEKQTYLIYMLLITIIGGLISLFTAISL